jgi:hypothetical protein
MAADSGVGPFAVGLAAAEGVMGCLVLEVALVEVGLSPVLAAD